MKMLLACLLAAAALPVAPADARPSTDAGLAGSWAVDVSRMPLPPAARPKSVTITFRDAGDGKLAMDVVIVDAAGAESRMASTAPLDGTPVALEPNPEADSAAMRMPGPNVLVLGLGRNGMPASTRTYAVDAGGEAMTEIASYVGTDGKPLLRVNHFTRVR
jgi:hypothetical protein